jgi:hypothetical protein
MKRIKESIAGRPYVATGLVFLGLAIVGVNLFGWYRHELELLLLLYVIAILGIRLDEISRKIGAIQAAAENAPQEDGTILAKLDEIAHSLKVLNHYLAKLTAARRTDPPSSAPKKNTPSKL